MRSTITGKFTFSHFIHYTVITTKYVIYTFLAGITALFLFFAFTGGACNHPRERIKMSEIMVMGSILKTEISEQMLATNSGEVDLSKINTAILKCEPGPNCLITDYEVTDAGRIKIDAAPLKSVIAFIPTPMWDQNNQLTGIKWECIGHPAEYMPYTCRIDKSKTLKEKSCQMCH